MAGIIKVLERHRNLIKVKYRGEFGYFWPTTNLTGEYPIKTFNDAENCLLNALEQSNDELIMVPIGYAPNERYFLIQGLDKTEIEQGGVGDLGTFRITATGQIKKDGVE